MTRAPLRFLLAILGLWVGARVAILLPAWTGDIGPVPAAARQRPPGIAVPGAAVTTGAAPQRGEPEALAAQLPVMPAPAPAPADLPEHRRDVFPLVRLAFTLPVARDGAKVRLAAAQWVAFSAPPPRLDQSRWSASGWILLRDEGDDTALAPGGILGGSQIGARLAYATGGSVALSGRAYLPLRRPTGAELAAGIDWRPVPALPVNLLAERRQRLGRDGRSAFALTLYGGASRSLTPRTRLDLYGQGGIVGLHSRDLFADASARLSRHVGRLEISAGAWGAAQPGAARLDAGPSLSWRLPVRDANLRLQADWRFRIAGDAAPRSGPALTLAADF